MIHGVGSARLTLLPCLTMLLSLLAAANLALAQPSLPEARSRVCVNPRSSVELTRDATQAVRWGWSWGSLLALNATVQLTLAGTLNDRGARIDRLVGGATSALGVLGVAVSHPRAARRLRSLGTCASQDDLSLTLESVAAEERSMRAWHQHVLGAVFNLGVGLYLWLAHDRLRSGGVQVVLGTAISSAMILTRPRRVAGLTLMPSVSSTSRALGLALLANF